MKIKHIDTRSLGDTALDDMRIIQEQILPLMDGEGTEIKRLSELNIFHDIPVRILEAIHVEV